MKIIVLYCYIFTSPLSSMAEVRLSILTHGFSLRLKKKEATVNRDQLQKNQEVTDGLREAH